MGLRGRCAKANGELAQFTATLSTQGTVELGATIVVDLPIGGTKEFGPFSVVVELPSINLDVDLGTYTSGGSKSDAVGPCTAGGDGDGDGDGDAAPDAAGVFTLTSSAYAEGGVIPELHTCNGDNTSPALAWSGAPTGPMSFGIIFVDLANDLRHSGIFDIPETENSLPAAMPIDPEPSEPAGSKQPRGLGNTPGYRGPCPGEEHTYRFTIYAIGTATLAGVDLDSSVMEVETALAAAALDTATLSGTYDPDNSQ